MTPDELRLKLEKFANSRTVVGQWLDDRKSLPTVENLDSIFYLRSQQAIADEIMSVISQFYPNIGSRKDLNFLDIGCSMGTFAMAMRSYAQYIVGVDVEEEAVDCARSYVELKEYQNMDFILESAITLDTVKTKYPNFFDVVVLKDVIEHISSVKNLNNMLLNISYVLKKDGVIFIEALNYIFPYEVHLKIPMIPFCPKFLLNLIASLFGRIKDDNAKRLIAYINVVTPFNVEKALKATGFSFINLYEEWKLKKIFFESYTLCDSYKAFQPVVDLSKTIGLGKLGYLFFKTTKLYPTLWYIAKKA